SSFRRTPRASGTSTSRSGPMRIAVDAMGGDHAPAEIVKGAALAAEEYGLDISLVGIPSAVQSMLDRKHPRVQLVPVTQSIAMDEHPAQAVRNKPDSSIAVCARRSEERRVGKKRRTR